MGGLGGQLDPLGVDRGGDPGDVDGRLGRRAAAASGVRSTAAANPQVPSTTTRTARPRSSASKGLQIAVGQADLLAPDPFGPEVGVLCAEVGGPLQRGIGELRAAGTR